MTESGTAPWGFPDALVGWVFGFFLTVAFAGVLISVGEFDPGEIAGIGSDAGRSAGQAIAAEPMSTRAMPLWGTALLQVPLWIGLGGAVLIACRFRGARPVEDLRFGFATKDVLPSIAIGVAAQLILIPLLYLPVRLLDDDFDLSGPARTLIESADRSGAVGIVLLVLVVAVGAPIFEELFFRGLLMGGLERHLPKVWALILSSVFFAAVHFQVAQFPALVAAGLVFGYLAQRTGRLGSAIVAHMAFNATTVVFLLSAT